MRRERRGGPKGVQQENEKIVELEPVKAGKENNRMRKEEKEKK